LLQFDEGTLVIYGGGFTISQFSESITGTGTFAESSVSGGFTEYTGFELSAAPASSSSLPTSGCTVIQINPTTITGTIGAGIALDDGKVTITGPPGSGLNGTQLTEFNNVYDLLISGQGSTINGNVVAGTYTINGAGGTGAGQFSATVNLSPLTVTGGLPSVVNRGGGLTLGWTGGNNSDLVEVIGLSATVSSAGLTGAEFICFTTAGAKGITVSASDLTELPAITAAQVTAGTGQTSLSVYSIASTTFTVPVVAGGTITNASFGGTFATTDTPAYQ
jgi:hypothetical protein